MGAGTFCATEANHTSVPDPQLLTTRAEPTARAVGAKVSNEATKMID